jgi:hypothetical protein
MSRIAILGWGSLLWNPKSLRNQRKWRSDGPSLQIEYARTSSIVERGGGFPYLSLVICSAGELVRTYWDMSLLTEIETAPEDLRSREGTELNAIGCLPRGRSKGSCSVPGIEARIQEWLISKENEVDAVIWTNLGWKIAGANTFTVEDGMKWLRDRRAEGRSERAEEYIRKTPSQTDTCARRQAREEYGWSDIEIGY